MPGPDRKRRLTAFVVAMAVLIVTPLAVVASDRFNDVPDSNIFHDDIAWLADNDITRGCNPPANDEFCPSDNVTRQQMAAFMRRLAENEVVNAATASEADNADTLDGQDGTAYETNVMAASCGIEVAPGPVAETTCLPSSGGQIGPGVNAEVLTISINVEAGSSLQLSTTALSGGLIAWSFTLNETCSADPETLLNRAVNGHIWGNDGNLSTAAHLTTTAPPGAHTVRLCGLNQDVAAVDQLTASLTAEWTAGGSVTIAGSGSSPVELPDLLNE